MERDHLQQLANRIANGTASEEELREYTSWYRSQVPSQIAESWNVTHFGHRDAKQTLLWQNIMQRVQNVKSRHRIRRIKKWASYAAAILLIASIVGFFAIVHQPSSVNFLSVSEVQPGSNRATLTLANGQTILLDETQSGVIIGQDIIYNNGQKVLTTGKESGMSEVPGLMSISTPKGGTYQVTLPDGSKVWLNADSKLQYPGQFDGNERIVELEGEAYFEVKQQQVLGNRQEKISDRYSDPHMPFRVVSKGQIVEVLGTSFNVSAYPDELDTRTTLVEGLIRLSVDQDAVDKNRSVALRPGQQAIFRLSSDQAKEEASFNITTVDTEPYVAWKNGKFVFEKEPLESIMKKLARWYDVDIVYKYDKTYGTFTGSISRHEHIDQILEKIKFTQAVDFKIEGRRIIIM